MTHKLLLLISASLLVTACHTVRELPDPRVSGPSIPGELMKPPERPLPLGNNV